MFNTFYNERKNYLCNRIQQAEPTILCHVNSTFIYPHNFMCNPANQFLWERRKCLRMQKRLFRESRKLEHTNHVASAILKNVHAFILLINNDFKVLKTNYYQQTGTRKGPEEKE